MLHEEALSKSNSIVSQSDDPALICTSVIDILERMLNYRRSCVVLIRSGDANPTVFVHSVRGISADERTDEIARVNLILGSTNKGVINSVLRSGESQIIRDTRNFEDYEEGCPQSLSEICVPLIVGGRTIGAFNAESLYRNAFDSQDGLLLHSIANQLALSIKSAHPLPSFDSTDPGPVSQP